MREEEVAIGLPEGGVAVGDVGELGSSLQPLRQRPAERGELVRRAALDPDQQQARRDALAELADQQPLRRGRRRGQERRHVGGEAGAGRDPRARGDEDEPDDERPARRAQRLSFEIVITDLSPLASRISILRTSPPVPPMSTLCTSSAIWGSLGRRWSRQSDHSPSSSTR